MLAAVDFFELALRVRTAIAVDTELVVALELFDRRLERGLVVAVLRAEEVSEIAQSGLLAGALFDRIEMADLDRKSDVLQRRRAVLDEELGALRGGGNLFF